jgi:predicted alpha/beta superfamily hydrolase
MLDEKLWMIGSNHYVDVKNLKNTAIYPWFYSTKGKTTVIDNVHSDQFNNDRSVIFYTPPSYYENPFKPYKNVLVMHDGQNLFDPKTAFMGNSWLIGPTLDEAIVTGAIEEIFVVGPYNTAQRMDEYTYIEDPEYGGGKGDLYLDWIEQTLLPLTQ